QQIIAFESGVPNTVDPVGGSYAIEKLTNEVEAKATEYLKKIDSLGGMLAAIESGWVQTQIQDAAYQYQRSIETKDRIVVGVNEFKTEDDGDIPIHFIDPALERGQIEALAQLRSKRDARAVARALERLDNAARSSENLLSFILEAVEAYATVGEISDAF